MYPGREMYCCQKTTQYPVHRTRNHMNRLLPASNSTSIPSHAHHGTIRELSTNCATRSESAMANAGSTNQALPTATQKFRATVPTEGGGESALFWGSRKNRSTTKNIAKTLMAATRNT